MTKRSRFHQTLLFSLTSHSPAPSVLRNEPPLSLLFGILIRLYRWRSTLHSPTLSRLGIFLFHFAILKLCYYRLQLDEGINQRPNAGKVPFSVWLAQCWCPALRHRSHCKLVFAMCIGEMGMPADQLVLAVHCLH